MRADLDPWLSRAREALERPRPLSEAERTVPGQPGLYAVYGGGSVWRALGLGEQPDGRPLYVGKAEDSLIVRDLKTHFGDGRTGSSTLRRSFAALLRDTLELRGMPRNPDKPGYYSSYGLSADHDAALTRWMREHLELGAWGRPSECAVLLGVLEDTLIEELLPPLNLRGVQTPWKARVEAARAKMANDARAWAGGER
jgi:hypothetical protein